MTVAQKVRRAILLCFYFPFWRVRYFELSKILQLPQPPCQCTGSRHWERAWLSCLLGRFTGDVSDPVVLIGTELPPEADVVFCFRVIWVANETWTVLSKKLHWFRKHATVVLLSLTYFFSTLLVFRNCWKAPVTIRENSNLCLSGNLMWLQLKQMHN